VRPNSRKVKVVTATVDGIELVQAEPALCGITSHLAESVCNSRGWTYQEFRLSSRHVIFVGGRVYYHCSKSARVETEPERSLEPVNAGLGSLSFFGVRNDNPQSIYAGHVQNYSRRQLTDPKDVLNAFKSMLSHFSQKHGFKFYSGIYFGDTTAWGLLWTPSSLRGNHQSEIRRRPDFPSWSWASFNGAVTYPGPGNSEHFRLQPEGMNWDSAAKNGILEFTAITVIINP
jgi:hypothetical protein